MKAAYIEATGSPDVIHYGDLPRPHPAAGEVLVRIGAVAVNPIDVYIRSGLVAMSVPRPFVIGCDLAGTVEAVGHGPGHFYRPGNRVWGSNQGLLGRQGTFAEYACVREDWLYPTPEGVSDAEAAAVALTGITAHLGLFRSAGLQRGETVFVNGGTGGVGSMVAQMAKAAGAQVIATVGSTEKAAVCQKWGIDQIINYRTEDVAASVQKYTQGQGVQVWFETQREPDLVRTVNLMARRGRIVLISGRQAQPILPVGSFTPRTGTLFGFALFDVPPDEHAAAPPTSTVG